MISRPSIPPALATARGHIREALVATNETKRGLLELAKYDAEHIKWRREQRIKAGLPPEPEMEELKR